MKAKYGIVVCLLGVTLSAVAVQWRDRIDLTRFLDDPSLLPQLSIRYSYPERPAQIFFIRGNGSLVLQQLPSQPGTWNSLVPTCTAHTEGDTFRKLVRLLVDRHFFDLPQKTFLFLSASDDPEKQVHIHTITVYTQGLMAARSFATGTYGMEAQSIPADFAAIESEIQRIRDDAFPQSGPCHVAAPLRF